MIIANLIVLYNFDKDEDGNPRREHLGQIELLVLPNPGDYISVFRRGQMENDVVRVKYVTHHAVEVPPPDSEPPIIESLAWLEIVADYTPFEI